MSESLAAFRDRRSKDLRQLAEEHLQHEYVREALRNPMASSLTHTHSLNQSDRDLLKSAGGKVSMHAGIASGIGLTLGLYAAIRLRTMRMAYFRAFRALEKPVEIRFADGRTGAFSPSHVISIHAYQPHQNPFPTSQHKSQGRHAGATLQHTSYSLSGDSS